MRRDNFILPYLLSTHKSQINPKSITKSSAILRIYSKKGWYKEMKKRITNVLPTLFAVCCLAGCGTVMAEVPKTSVPNEAAYESSAQAVETNQERSDEERAQEEKVRREEIAEQYSIYNEFGLSYDKDKDRFLYDGNIVRYFNDTISEDSTNAFFYEDGTVDLKPIRNSSGKLTGLEIASDKEFAERTKKNDELKSQIQDSGIGEAGSFELGEPDTSDDSLAGYSEYGVSYNAETKRFMFDGKDIYFFYDSDGATYVNYDVKNGVSVKVVRDKTKKIEKIDVMTDDEVKELLK